MNASETTIDDPICYNFPALRGYQAGREYYVVMCPLKNVPNIFSYDENEIPPEIRSQRVLTKGRLPEITRYIANNPENYIFSSLTASVDRHVEFTPFGEDTLKTQLGRLKIPMDARILINDGQHRKAAIERVLKERPELGYETISVVLFLDAGLKRSQQMFADLNKHAVRPSRSLGILYDHRDPLAALARELTNRVPIFQERTELEKNSVPKRSDKVFTLSCVFQATKELLDKRSKRYQLDPEEKVFAVDYWTEMVRHMPEWQLVIENGVSPAELRQRYISVHGVTLHALGRLGTGLKKEDPERWREKLPPLSSLDWSRENTALWEGRALSGGRLSKTRMNVLLTGNILKKTCGVRLTEKEMDAERSLANEMEN